MKETQEGGPGRSLCVYKVQRERRTRPDDVQAVLSEKELPAVYERMWNLRVTVDTRPPHAIRTVNFLDKDEDSYQ